MNDCLQTGLPLKNLLGSLMVWNRLKPVALCGDIIKQAFLQERIREADGDTFRFHWIRDKVCNLYRERDRSIKIVLFLIVGSVSLSSGETVPTKWRPCQDEIITTAGTVENQEKTIENKSKVLQITNKNTNNIVTRRKI